MQAVLLFLRDAHESSAGGDRPRLGREVASGLLRISQGGCAIYSAPNYRYDRDGNDYACRNSPGSLLRAADLFSDQNVLIVLCDPDMVFVRRIEFPETLTGEFSSFMDYDRDFVNDVLPKLGVARDAVDRRRIRFASACLT
jgi:hypothetical protein